MALYGMPYRIGEIMEAQQHIDHHRHIARLYEEAFAEVEGIEFHAEPQKVAHYATESRLCKSNYWLNTITLSPQLRVKGQEMAYKQVVTGAVGGAAGVTHAVEEDLFKVGLCLPSGPCVTDEDVRYIVECIKEAKE